MTKDQIGSLIAKNLWKYFEFDLPDTPNRITKIVLKTLEANDLTIVTKDSLEPIYRCSGCGAQIARGKLCGFCVNWKPLARLEQR